MSNITGKRFYVSTEWVYTIKCKNYITKYFGKCKIEKDLTRKCIFKGKKFNIDSRFTL